MQTAVILAGHGSRSAEANSALRALADSLGARIGCSTVAAYLELAEPSISTTILGCVLGGAQRVVVVPYFLHPGMHVRRDIEAIVATARAAHPHVDLRVAPFLGSHPGVAAALADLTERALS